jgi:hypothetical protein
MSDADPRHIPSWPPHRPPPPRPPIPPPHPGPDPDDLNWQQLRELVEVQQRTIRFLISQYNDLLDILEREEDRYTYKVEWEFEDHENFVSGDKIPSGWWQNLNATPVNIDWTDKGGTHHTPAVDPYDFILSDGEIEAAGTFTLVPIREKITRERKDG